MWILNLIKDMILSKKDNLFKERRKDDIRCSMSEDNVNYKRVLVIGDIHGHYTKFKSLYSKLNVTDDDLVIFLGDYIDRGPENLLMIRWIMRESQNDNIIALRGNHEQMMIDCIRNGDINWIFNGGNETAKEIKSKIKEHPNLMKEIVEFAESLPLYYRKTINGQDYFFCHAGVDPKVPLEEQTSMSLLWIREGFFKHYDGDAIIVVGHTPLLLLNPEGSLETWCKDYQKVASIEKVKPQWRRNKKILLMDTGSYFPNGCISCMDMISGKLWQSD